MALNKAVRWVPVEGLPELALGGLDLSYEASKNRLTVRAYFRDLSKLGFPQFEPDCEGVIIDFESVHAFKAYEEFSDPFYAEGHDIPLLAEKVPYGGTWGFLRVLGSSWLRRLADRNCGWTADSASHWIVTTGDMVLHIAAQSSAAPAFRSWIRRSDVR